MPIDPPDYLPSGKNIGDWENHVLKMVKKFADGKMPDTDDESEIDDVPHGWYFTGWMSFRLFGPKPLCEDVSFVRLFDNGDNLSQLNGSEKKKMGRTHQRQEEKKSKDNSRDDEAGTSIVAGTSIGRRGIPLSQEIGIVNIAQNLASAKERKESGVIDSLLCRLGHVEQSIMSLGDRFDKAIDREFSTAIIDSIHQEREDAKEQKKTLNEKIDALQANTNETSDEWAFVESFLQPIIKKTQTERVSDTAKTRKKNDSNAATAATNKKSRTDGVSEAVKTRTETDSNAATAANTCRCPIPNCAETLDIPTHKCHRVGCDLTMHNLCAQRENFTSDINELDMYCSLVHKNEQEGKKNNDK